MVEQLNEYQTRLQRLEQLKAAGVIPYANKYDKQQSIKELKAIHEDPATTSQQCGAGWQMADANVLMKEGAKQKYSTAGRMMSFRTMGKLSFAHLRDHSGDIQICFVKHLCHFNIGRAVVDTWEIAGQEISAYKLAEKFLDIGDFVGVKGELFVTKHGELTLFVDEFQLLSKALRPLGNKRHGVKDQEALYRQRYLDLTMNPESYERFLFKSKFYKALRKFYEGQWFEEIVTSVLGNAASGAAAKPFITHHNDYDLDVYLRIAFEPWLKMATVGRYEKVFEIGKDFRNEGSDPSHLQEFTQVEHYAARRNYEDNMHFTEKMFDHLFTALELNKKLPIKNKEGESIEVDRSTPWQKIDYIEGVKKASGGIDITQYENKETDQVKLVADIKAKGHTREGMETQGVTTLIDYLYKKVLRPTIVWPAFVYNYPRTMQPLARQNDANPNIVEQFQVVVNGREIIKAYSELVDPTIQKDNFDEQAVSLEKGDEEATSGDSDFLLAMEHGMPCQSWFGMGIERILALLTQQDNLRDVVMFPLMKPIQNMKSDEISDETQWWWNSQNILDPSTKSSGWQAWEWNNTIDYWTLPSRDQAQELANKYLTDTKLHCEQVGQVMAYFAKKLWEDEHLRYLAGLLHDVDRDHIGKDAEAHLWEEFEKMMDAINVPDLLKEDIRSHYEEGTGVPVDSLIRKYLASVDELTGFIYACSLMRPTGLEWMKWKSLNKKIKTKTFAAGVHRESLRYCEQYLDIPLSEFSLEVVEAMKEMINDKW